MELQTWTGLDKESRHFRNLLVCMYSTIWYASWKHGRRQTAGRKVIAIDMYTCRLKYRYILV